jgi:hypothetical protein
VGGMEVLLHLYLTSALGGGERSDSCPGRLPLGKDLRNALVGGWVSSRADLDAVQKKSLVGNRTVIPR